MKQWIKRIHNLIFSIKDHKQTHNGINVTMPSKDFIAIYTDNQRKEEAANKIKKEIKEFDQAGNRLERNYIETDYHRIHDPLNIFKKKGNYEDLAWKVFNDVEDSNIFLKVLYYPRIIKEDYKYLVQAFSKENQSLYTQQRLSLIISLGVLLGSWAAAYKYNLKFKTFVGLTAVTFIITKNLLNNRLRESMCKRLNINALPIAERYPEIKFSRIEYNDKI